MIQFIKTILFAIKKKYGYYAQELGDSELQKVQQRVQNKQSDSSVSNVQYEKNKYIFPSYEAFEKACYAFIEEEKERERHTTKRKKTAKRTKKNVQVRTLWKHKRD